MIYIFLADGFETVEALATVDVIRRAGLQITTVGVTGKVVTTAQGIPITADITEDEFQYDDVECVILPGGMPGVTNLEKSAVVNAVLEEASQDGTLIAAICAAPSILGKKGLLRGKNATCYPGFESALDGATLSKEYVVKDGDYITGRGAGVSIDFGLEIVKELVGEKTAENIRESIQCKKVIKTKRMKTELRKEFKLKRHNLAEKGEKSTAICERFLESEIYKNATSILTYVPMADEVNASLITENALKDGKTVAAPRCEDKEGHMAFYEINSFSDLEKGTFGILEPKNYCKKILSNDGAVIIVPAIAYDETGYRLGYGGGYYDRFLATCSHISVGLCYNELLTVNLPHYETDKAVNFIVTENRILAVKGEPKHGR